jgi:hypothetical protein
MRWRRREEVAVVEEVKEVTEEGAGWGGVG